MDPIEYNLFRMQSINTRMKALFFFLRHKKEITKKKQTF